MAGYQGMTRVSDEATRGSIKHLFDEIARLTRRIDALEQSVLTLTTATVDVNNRRLTSVADPQGGSDAVTLSYLRAYVEAQAKVL